MICDICHIKFAALFSQVRTAEVSFSLLLRIIKTSEVLCNETT